MRHEIHSFKVKKSKCAIVNFIKTGKHEQRTIGKQKGLSFVALIFLQESDIFKHEPEYQTWEKDISAKKQIATSVRSLTCTIWRWSEQFQGARLHEHQRAIELEESPEFQGTWAARQIHHRSTLLKCMAVCVLPWGTTRSILLQSSPL